LQRSEIGQGFFFDRRTVGAGEEPFIIESAELQLCPSTNLVCRSIFNIRRLYWFWRLNGLARLLRRTRFARNPRANLRSVGGKRVGKPIRWWRWKRLGRVRKRI
jgi:hypothetical protein